MKLWIFDIKIEIQQPSHRLLCRDKRALPIAQVDDDDDDSVGVKLAVVVDVVFEAGVTDRGQGERERERGKEAESQSRGRKRDFRFNGIAPPYQDFSCLQFG